MLISELILDLEAIKVKHGDIPVCVSEQDEYWGRIEHELHIAGVQVAQAQPKGPKSGESVLAVVLCP